MALERLLANYQDGRRQPRGLWGEALAIGGRPSRGPRQIFQLRRRPANWKANAANEGSRQPVDATKTLD